MTETKRKSLIAALLCLCLGFAGSASAAAVIAFEEVAGDVVGTLTGSLDFTGAAVASSSNGTFGALLSGGDLISAPNAGASTIGYVVAGGPSFAVGPAITAVSRSGIAFHLAPSAALLFWETGYINDSLLSGSIVFGATSLEGLGAPLGNYVYTLSNQDTLTLRFGPERVVATLPLPGSLPLVAVALALAAWRSQRRRGEPAVGAPLERGAGPRWDRATHWA